jgi:hypothetical protein
MNSLPAWLALLVAGTGGYLVEQALPASLRALKDGEIFAKGLRPVRAVRSTHDRWVR